MNEHFMQTFAVPGNWDKKEMGGHPAQSVCTTRIMSIEVMDRPQDCKLQSLLSPFNGEAWWTATCLSRNRVWSLKSFKSSYNEEFEKILCGKRERAVPGSHQIWLLWRECVSWIWRGEIDRCSKWVIKCFDYFVQMLVFKLSDLSPSVRIQWKYGKLKKVRKVKTYLTIWHQLVFEPNRSGRFGEAQSVNILVILNPTGYMLTSSGFAFIHLRYIL